MKEKIKMLSGPQNRHFPGVATSFGMHYLWPNGILRQFLEIYASALLMGLNAFPLSVPDVGPQSGCKGSAR